MKMKMGFIGKTIATRVLSICGEIDYKTANDLEVQFASILNSGTKTLIVDLRKVKTLDDHGMNALIKGRRMFQGRGGSIVVICPDKRIRWSFEELKLDDPFVIVGTVDDALKLIETRREEAISAASAKTT